MIISICTTHWTTHTTAWENLFASRALQQTQVVSDGPAKEPSVVRGLFGLVWADDAFARGRVGHAARGGAELRRDASVGKGPPDRRRLVRIPPSSSHLVLYRDFPELPSSRSPRCKAKVRTTALSAVDQLGLGVAVACYPLTTRRPLGSTAPGVIQR
jgi:hypothetical protein